MTVEVPVPADDVSTPMRNMRQWLDDMRFDALSFAWIEIDRRTVVRVKFNATEEAVAFAEHFADACFEIEAADIDALIAERGGDAPVVGMRPLTCPGCLGRRTTFHVYVAGEGWCLDFPAPARGAHPNTRATDTLRRAKWLRWWPKLAQTRNRRGTAGAMLSDTTTQASLLK